MKKLLPLLVTVIIFGLNATSANGQENIHIIADPDVRISYDGNVAHMEAYIAASATDPNFLIAGGEIIVPGRKLQATEARLYYSADAGARWSSVLLPNEISGGWDNAVTAGVEGKMYFLTSNLKNGLTVYRTSDNGKNWKFTVISNTQGWDRPYIVVDNTVSSYRGRLYIVGETEEGVTVISSSDGGETFSQLVIACRSQKNWNVATTSSPLIMDDGSLVVSCAPYPNFPARADWKDAKIGLVFSKDGGQTFTEYHEAFTIKRQLPKDYYSARVKGDVLLSGNFMIGPSFAVSSSKSSFANRMYAVWQDIDSTGLSRLFFSWSADNGLLWSTPKPVADASQLKSKNTNTVRQGVPMLAVNQEGIVGVAWFDGRNAVDNKGYDIYFTASTDGGLTFLPSVRVSSETSQPAKYGQNTLPQFIVNKPSEKGERVISMISPFSTRSTGADYSTMTVDALGRFHPLWMDARNGAAWQLYTSTVRVISEKTLQTLAEKHLTLINKNNLHNCVLDDRIQVLLGEPQWNNKNTEILMPMRILNTSSDTIIESIKVKLSGIALSSSRPKTYAKVSIPKFFNSIQATFSDSTEFIYPISLHTPLFPNGVTAIQNLRMKITSPEWIDFNLQATLIDGGCLIKK